MKGSISKGMLKHRGYKGHAEFDDEADLFYGEVLDLRDVITVQSTSVEELEREFRDSIDDYLEFCEERGEELGCALRREDDGNVSGTVLLAKYLP